MVRGFKRLPLAIQGTLCLLGLWASLILLAGLVSVINALAQPWLTGEQTNRVEHAPKLVLNTLGLKALPCLLLEPRGKTNFGLFRQNNRTTWCASLLKTAFHNNTEKLKLALLNLPKDLYEAKNPWVQVGNQFQQNWSTFHLNPKYVATLEPNHNLIKLTEPPFLELPPQLEQSIQNGFYSLLRWVLVVISISTFIFTNFWQRFGPTWFVVLLWLLSTILILCTVFVLFLMLLIDAGV